MYGKHRFTNAIAAMVMSLSMAEAQSMPGTQVGTPLVKPVGTQIPKAVSSVGTKVGMVPNGSPAPSLTTAVPQGQQVDLSQVTIPYPGMPQNNSYLTSLGNAWKSLFGSSTPATATNWTPGIARRNHQHTERKKLEMWMRD